jgi:hypothetical protein
MSAPYEIPQPWATAPQMGTKFSPDMTFFQRVFNSIAWAVQYDVRYVCNMPWDTCVFGVLSWSCHYSHNYIETLIKPLNDKFDTGMKLYDSFKDVRAMTILTKMTNQQTCQPSPNLRYTRRPSSSFPPVLPLTSRACSPQTPR